MKKPLKQKLNEDSQCKESGKTLKEKLDFIESKQAIEEQKKKHLQKKAYQLTQIKDHKAEEQKKAQELSAQKEQEDAIQESLENLQKELSSEVKQKNIAEKLEDRQKELALEGTQEKLISAHMLRPLQNN